MRTFLIQPEHDPSRLIKQIGESKEAVQATLVGGYRVVSEILDGVTVPVLPDGLPHYSFLTHLLIMYGDELKAWMKDQGFDTKQTAVLTTAAELEQILQEDAEHAVVDARGYVKRAD